MSDDGKSSLKSRSSEWIKNKWNLALLAVLIFAIAVRIYFFTQTISQPLWWDEAEYMSVAKHWQLGVPYDLNPQRPPLFSSLSALAFIMGFGETFIKFFLVLLPSAFFVFTVYLLGKEMFNSKVGLISSALAAVSWTLLFWSVRMQPDFFSISFSVLAVVFMWKYWKGQETGKGKTKFILWSGFFAAMGLYFKVSALLIPMVFIVFLFIKDGLSAFKNKDYYYFSAAFIGTLVPYFIWAVATFGNVLAFSTGYSNQVINPTLNFGWYALNFLYTFNGKILFALFLLGGLMGLNFLFYFDKIAGKKKLNANLFSVLAIIIIAAFYIFYIRGAEDRWLFLWLPFIFFLISNGLIFIYDKVKPYEKNVALAVVIILLAAGMFMQLSHANNLIDQKKDSYEPVKAAGIWINENFDGEVVIAESLPQMTYYAESEVVQYSEFSGKEDFGIYVKENDPLIVISVFEAHPEWAYEWIQENQNGLTPLQAYFADEGMTQPLIVVYRSK